MIKQFYGTLTDTNTLGQRKPKNNGNKGALHISQISKTDVSLLDAV